MARKVVPIAVEAPDEVMVSLYEAQKKIYPRSVSGIFTYWRWGMIWLTQIIFYGLPWLEWGQRQAVLFDLGVRRFYIFGLVLYPQDLIYLTGLLVISALSLFLFTAVAGRLWCGFACPQTVYTEMFLWVERKIEGDRAARMRLDEMPISMEKLGKKGAKHLIWVCVALWTGFTFVGYFTPIRELGVEFSQANLGPWETFWVFFYGFATYGNAGFMREQVCKYMCPYARFQSAMFDRDTLIVTYDEERGEPRGGRSRKIDIKEMALGACVDCSLCVQVCPTGIDIRNGLQYECIGCGACADICDTVMDKMGYERGLVKFSTQNGIANNWSRQQMLQRLFRPRVMIYASVLLLICIGIMVSLNFRSPFKVDVVRDRGVMSRIVDDDKVENVYRIQIMNATEHLQHYKIAAGGLPGLEVESYGDESDDVVSIAPAQSKWVTMHLRIAEESAIPGSHGIQFVVNALDSADQVSEKSVFLVPR